MLRFIYYFTMFYVLTLILRGSIITIIGSLVQMVIAKNLI